MVSWPKMPSNSRLRWGAAVRRASRWSMLRLRCGTGAGLSRYCSGRADGGCQPVDPVGEITRGVGEGVVGAGAGGVGDRPVQAVGDPGAELFVSVVADGYDEVVRAQRLVDVSGAGGGQGQAAFACGRHGTRVDAQCGLGPR